MEDSAIDILSGAPIGVVGVRRVSSMYSCRLSMGAIERRWCDTF